MYDTKKGNKKTVSECLTSSNVHMHPVVRILAPSATTLISHFVTLFKLKVGTGIFISKFAIVDNESYDSDPGPTQSGSGTLEELLVQ